MTSHVQWTPEPVSADRLDHNLVRRSSDPLVPGATPSTTASGASVRERHHDSCYLHIFADDYITIRSSGSSIEPRRTPYAGKLIDSSTASRRAGCLNLIFCRVLGQTKSPTSRHNVSMDVSRSRHELGRRSRSGSRIGKTAFIIRAACPQRSGFAVTSAMPPTPSPLGTSDGSAACLP